MSANGHHWIVFHRVRFSSPVDGRGHPFPGPERAEAWRFYPACPLGADGLPTYVSDEWGGIGIYRSQGDAEAVYESPEENLLFLGETIEAYHALALPFSHRGKVDWRGVLLENTTLTVAPSDPGGPLMVLTSAGYIDPGPADLPRIMSFVYEIRQVQSYFATLPDNLRNAVFSGPGVDGRDGMTVSLWQNDEAMLTAAYRAGYHRNQMQYQRGAGHFDYSSFTRTRLLATKGTWDGSDPVQDAAVPEPACSAPTANAALSGDFVAGSL